MLGCGATMRRVGWALLGIVAAACGGSAFNPQGDGAAGASAGGSGGEPGAAGRGGRPQGGSATTGGKPSVSGASPGGRSPTGGTESGGAGTAGAAGTLPMAGEPGVAGAPPEGADTSCPATPEALGDACQDGLVCTFGDDIRTSCRPRARCEVGKWVLSQPPCEDLAACDKVIVGQECDGAVPECLLTESIYCRCTACPTSGPCMGGGKTVWACASGSGVSGCPDVPPNWGASCNASSSCSYGSCGTQNNLNVTCDGTWSWELAICPK